MGDPRTVAEALLAGVETRPDDTAIRERQPGGQTLTWAQYGTAAAKAAAGLRGLGVGPGDRLLLALPNGIPFHVADTAATALGACPISVHLSAPVERIRFIAAHSEAAVAVVSGGEVADRWRQAQAWTPGLRTLVTLEGSGAVSWEEVAGASPLDLEAAARGVSPESHVTAIYTSGTTGVPKAVLLTHANVTWTCRRVRDRLGVSHAGWRWINYLPMAHIATRFVGHYFHLHEGTTIICAPNPAEIQTVIVEERPNFLFAPPRIWDGIRATAMDHLTAMAETDATAGREALQEGMVRGARLIRSAGRQRDAPPVPHPVLEQLRAHIGLDQCRWASAGGAPAAPDLLAFLHALGITISDNYGLSESTAMVCFDPFEYCFGRLGRPLAGVEVRIEADSEIVFRGGNSFAGYQGDPQETRRVVDSDGWVHTGDLGRLDRHGYLELLGRKKDLIITAGAENVAPAPIEGRLDALPLVSQSCVVGEGRPYLVALLHLDPQGVASWLEAHGRPPADAESMANDPALIGDIQAAVEVMNRTLHRPERIRRFLVLPGAWEIDSDEVTPTAKLRRSMIAQKYGKQIEELYATEPSPTPA